MSHHLHRTLLPALCVATALGLAACSPSAGAAASSDAAAPAKPSSAPLPHGSTLKHLLLPASALPAHLKADPTGTRDTGTAYNPATSSPVPTAKACSSLDASDWVETAGIGSITFAQNDYTSSTGAMFAQEIDGFRGEDATAVMSALKSVFTTCAGFKVDQDGSTYTAKLVHKELPGVGDDAVQAVITSPSWEGGETLIAARVGNLVVTTLYNDQKTTGSADTALTKTLVKRVQAAHLG